MQYRAIGLIKGTYVPSEEQFTRGTLMTDNNHPIDAVLLGRVMSLVKKHVDLTTSHLWVVYPRTRPKHEHLHAQIVGIWEPDNLHQDGDDVEDESAEQPDSIELVSTATEADEGSLDLTDVESAESVAESLSVENSDDISDDSGSNINDESVIGDSSIQDESDLISESDTLVADDSVFQDSEKRNSENTSSEQTGSTATKLVKPARPRFSAADVQASRKVSAEVIAHKPVRPGVSEKGVESPPFVTSPSINLKDGYFSIRGEVMQFSPDTQEITVRIRQANRKSASSKDEEPKEDKEFKLQLQGLLQGRVVGYFWDFHVQRSGNNLVVDEATMIGIVPPRKTRRKKFVGKGGGRGGFRRRPDGGRSSDRPTRSGDRPTPVPTRRGASSKPVLKKSILSSDSGAETPKAES